MKEGEIMQEEKTALPVKNNAKRYFITLFKLFTVFLLLFTIFLAVMIYQVKAVIEYRASSSVAASDKFKYELPDHPLKNDALNFLKCPHYLPDNYDIKRSIAKNIDKTIEGKFEIPPKIKADFIEKNMKLRDFMFEMAAKEPAAEEAILPDIPETLEVRYNSKYYYFIPVNSSKIAQVLTRLALNEKDYIPAMKFDLALLRLARAVAVGAYNTTTLINVMIQETIIACANDTPGETYISHNELFADTAAVAFMRKAIAIRAASTKLFFDFGAAFIFDAQWLRSDVKRVRDAFPWTMAFLDLYYGKSETARIAYYKEIKAVSAGTLCDQLAFVKKFEHLCFKSSGEESKESGSEEKAEDYIKYLWTNPFSREIPDFKNAFIINARAKARYRLVTLGAMARLFYFDNGRWPDLSKDAEFVKSSDLAVIDPVDGKPMRSVMEKDDSMVFYSIGADLIDDGGNKINDITISVKKPVK